MVQVPLLFSIKESIDPALKLVTLVVLLYMQLSLLSALILQSYMYMQVDACYWLYICICRLL